MADQPTCYHSPGMKLVASYLLLLLVNILILSLANYLFPTQIVLGTATIPRFWALLHSLGTLSLIVAFSVPLIRAYERRQDRLLSHRSWIILYLILNFITLWLIARFPYQFGLGLSSWLVALILAIVLDAAQGIILVNLDKRRPHSQSS